MLQFYNTSYGGAVAGTASADVESANICGYQNIALSNNWSFKTITFKKINGGQYKLNEIRCLKPDGTEWAASGNTSARTYNQIRISKIKPNGDYATLYSYSSRNHTDGKQIGWMVGTTGEVRVGDDVVFENGEGMIIECTRSDLPVLQFSGEVSLTDGRALPNNWSFSGNYTPVSIKLKDIKCLKPDGSEWAASGNTSARTYNQIRISKIKPNGDYGTLYSYSSRNHTDGKQIGWMVGTTGEVRVGDDVVFAPGEGFIVECTRSDLPILKMPNPIEK